MIALLNYNLFVGLTHLFKMWKIELQNIMKRKTLYFKRVTPITMKSILPSGPLKTKLIIINYNSHDKKPFYK